MTTQPITEYNLTGDYDDGYPATVLNTSGSIAGGSVWSGTVPAGGVTHWQTPIAPNYSITSYPTTGPGLTFTQPTVSIDASTITFKGVRLDERLVEIEKRLAILKPSLELEEKWEELKELGEKYRQLEKEILEKENVWNIIKK